MPRRYSQSFGAYQLDFTDGIIDWFNGPHWDDIAYQQFLVAEGQIEDAARDNAIWEDRTGDARDGLHAQTLKTRDGVVSMSLSHGVEYGIWLELIQNGRFAVIMKTLNEEAPRLIANTMRRIRYARKGTS